MLGKLKKTVELFQEKWRESRVPPNTSIFSVLKTHIDKSLDTRKGIHQYLEDYPTLGEIKVERDWYLDD